jgi:hypothetical protein
VADHQLYTDVKLESARKYVQYMHRAGEDTGIGSSDVDLVTISLVSHELPQAATKYVHTIAIFIIPTMTYDTCIHVCMYICMYVYMVGISCSKRIASYLKEERSLSWT